MTNKIETRLLIFKLCYFFEVSKKHFGTWAAEYQKFYYLKVKK